jgi:hypothetical protein
VKLLYEVFVAPYQVATTRAELIMRDDGLGGDAIAGDRQFTVQLPAMGSQTLVRYRVQAADTAGRAAIYPDAVEPNPNEAYFVYGSAPWMLISGRMSFTMQRWLSMALCTTTWESTIAAAAGVSTQKRAIA